MKNSLFVRVFTHGLVQLLVAGQVLAGIPQKAASPSAAIPDSSAPSSRASVTLPAPPTGGTVAPAIAPKVDVNVKVPAVSLRGELPTFSTPPTDGEIFSAHVFDEPLVPMGGPSSEAENGDLAQALLAYAKAGDGERVGPLTDFLGAHPNTRWRASLLTGLALAYRRHAYFSRALEAAEEAWRLTKSETDPSRKAVADRSLALLAELNGRLGRYEELDALFAEIEGRDVGGSAGEWIIMARQGRQQMKANPGMSFRCGPYALENVFQAQHGRGETHPVLAAAKSTESGTSLAQISKWADDAGMGLRMAKRDGAASIPLPAVVHWKAGHFAALLEERNGRYRAQDPTFDGGNFWVSAAALADEGSGYFLVPRDAPESGWAAVTEDTAGSVWGKGFVNNLEFPPPNQPQPSTCPPDQPMAQYTFQLFTVGLKLFDRPINYTPAVGPSVSFRVDYNQRESLQPMSFTYSNFGRKWTYSWLSYIEDTTDTAADVNLYGSGGGRLRYTNMSGGTSNFQDRDQSRLVRNSTSPIQYTRELSDGSKEIFGGTGAALGSPARKVFLKQIIDRFGQAITFQYDGTGGNLRLWTVTDATGQVTSLSYTNTDPTKVTRVTDPFGRAAIFDYDAAGRLLRITDPIGISSQFGYADADFVSSLTTPYGVTTFTTGLNGHALNYWVEATDPLGAKEHVEFNQDASLYGYTIPMTDPNPPTVPGVTTLNNYLIYRNTYYWDKRAWGLYPRDPSKAHVYHWLHLNVADPGGVGAAILESEKKPLEGRVWYSYPGQPNTGTTGSSAQPTAIARVLDNGVTQVYKYEYNARGKLIKSTDPLLRETVYAYGTGCQPDGSGCTLDSPASTGTGTDLLEIRQKNGGGYDLLWSGKYNDKHKLLYGTDAARQETAYTYLLDGRLSTITTPARNGPGGTPLTAAERTTTRIYYSDLDAPTVRRRLLRVLGPTSAQGARITAYTYDGYGRTRSVTDEEDYTLTYDYDAIDRVTKIVYPDGTFAESVYDRLDPVRQRDRLGRWTEARYNSQRRLVSSRDAAGGTTTFGWCACGSMDSITDPNGNQTRWERDIQARTVREVRADGKDWLYTYEARLGRVAQRRDANGKTTSYTYTTDNNLLNVSYPSSTTPTNAYQYDIAYNRLTQITTGTDVTQYTYHPVTVGVTLGATRLKAVQGPIAGDVDLVTYDYDELGRANRREINGAVNSLALVYDSLGRATSEANSLGYFTYTYQGATSRLATVTYPNGQTTEFSYQGNTGDHRIQDIHNKRIGGATLSRFSYTTTAKSLISEWTQQLDSSPATTYGLAYDGLDQLTLATIKSNVGAVLKSYDYAYDKAGNRFSEAVDLAVTTSVYNGRNQLASMQTGGALSFSGNLNEQAAVTVAGNPALVSGDNKFAGNASVVAGSNSVAVTATDGSGLSRTQTYQVTVGGSTGSFTYDFNGNLLSDGTRTYEWDVENRLTAVVQGSLRSEFTYNGAGERVRVVEKNGGTVTSNRFYVWCGLRPCEERDSAGVTVLRRFQSGGIYDVSTFTPMFYAFDHLGNIREMTDGAGTVRARYAYDLFGRQTKLSGDRDAPFGYTGHFSHAQSGLFLAKHRAYSPNLGRWISEDPLGMADGANLYRYVRNDPANKLDPTGRVAIVDDLAALFVIGIVITALATVALINNPPVIPPTAPLDPDLPANPPSVPVPVPAPPPGPPPGGGGGSSSAGVASPSNVLPWPVGGVCRPKPQKGCVFLRTTAPSEYPWYSFGCLYICGEGENATTVFYAPPDGTGCPSFF